MSLHYLLISLPQSVGSADSLYLWLNEHVNGGDLGVSKMALSAFKVGTLDSLVEQSEQLAKVDSQLGASSSKVVEIAVSVGGEAAKAHLKVEGKPVDRYVESFGWNSSRYRLDRPTAELIETISGEALNLDADLKAAFGSYSAAKSNLLASQRKQSGDLTVRSLHDVVSKDDFVLGSEHLVTELVVVPKSLERGFLDTYETVVPFVVPRSARLISQDAEYVLYGVTLFRKYRQQFVTACREHKWVPREFNYSEAAVASMRSEYATASKQEAEQKNDLTRLAREAYSEITAAWLHIKTLRTFVESVLRYGLPPDFLCFLLKLKNEKGVLAAKKDLIGRFGYLGGNAFSLDKNGRPAKDSLHEYASLVDQEYEPFVVYEMELA